MSNSLKKNILNGFIWSTGGSVAVTVISLLSNIILARIISVEDFGIAGILLFFINVSNVFLTGGLASVLVREKEVSNIDYNTVFTFNLLMSLFFYSLLFLFSGPISIFYNIDDLSLAIKVSGLVLIINAFQIVNNVSLIRAMKFKERMLFNFNATVFSSILSIALALIFEIGFWALIILNISNQAIILFQMLIFERVEVKIGWSKVSFQKYLKFGVFTSLSNLINTAYSNIYQLLIAKYFNISQVGFYYQAQKLDKVPVNIVNYFAQNVLYSGLSKVQDDENRIVIAYNKTLKLLTALVTLMTISIFLYSEPIIILLFGIKWIDSSIYLKILSAASFFSIQELFNRVLFKVYNKTYQIFKLELVKKGFQTLIIIFSIYKQDLYLMVSSILVTSIFSLLINIHFTNKILKGLTDYLLLAKVLVIAFVLFFVNKAIVEFFDLQGLYLFFSYPVILSSYFVLIYFILNLNLNSLLLIIKNK